MARPPPAPQSVAAAGAVLLWAALLGGPGSAAASPSSAPTGPPTATPTKSPTGPPTGSPTGAPTASPSRAPSAPTNSPTGSPTAPTVSPSRQPTGPTGAPTAAPTQGPMAQLEVVLVLAGQVADFTTARRQQLEATVRATASPSAAANATIVALYAASVTARLSVWVPADELAAADRTLRRALGHPMSQLRQTLAVERWAVTVLQGPALPPAAVTAAGEDDELTAGGAVGVALLAAACCAVALIVSLAQGGLPSRPCCRGSGGGGDSPAEGEELCGDRGSAGSPAPSERDASVQGEHRERSEHPEEQSRSGGSPVTD
eukprot:TRINITY_DN12214_c0_g1_i1.p2 TRINITY_DN12214_c0_g1~~TRINITY_DN12214_c0_g1_i1.p2  ORF type:complete len:342 (+),score=88.00 TRINITY_DN12214_c0_g1_i1:78-1028(+)